MKGFKITHTLCPDCLLNGGAETRLLADEGYSELHCPVCGKKFSATSVLFRYVEVATELARTKRSEIKEKAHEHAA